MNNNKMNIEKLWEMVINSQAVAINKNGGSISGEIARQYDMESDWKIVSLNSCECWYVEDGKIIEKENKNERKGIYD